MRVRIGIGLIFWMIALNGFSQALYGKVVDTTGSPVRGVILTLRDSTSKKIIAYGMSNNEGGFKIKLNETPENSILSVKHVSYQERIFNFKGVINEFLEIKIFPSVASLKEIVITSDIPITLNGDTTTFNARKYLDPEDRKLKDLFKKMPGFSVNENGRLSYKGKLVEKLFIDGDDPGGFNYGLITQNMSPDGVDKVEVIDNFDDNRLLKAVRKSDNVAVNIRMKSEYLLRLSGSVSVGLSGGKKRNGDLSTTLMGKKVKQLNFFTANNVGESLGENFDGTIYKSPEEILLDLNNDDQVEVISAGGISVPNIDERLTLHNNDQGGASMMSWRLCKSVKMNGQIGVRNTNKWIKRNETINFEVPGVNQWKTYGVEKQTEKNTLLFSTFSFKKDAGGKSSSNGHLILKKDMRASSYLNLLGGSVIDSMSEILKNNSWRYDANWTKTILLGKKVIRIVANSERTDGSQRFNIYTLRLLKFFNIDSSQVNYLQKSNKIIDVHTVEFKLNEKNKNSFLEYGLNITDINNYSAFDQFSIHSGFNNLNSDSLKTSMLSGYFYGKRSLILAPKLSLSIKAIAGIGRLGIDNKIQSLPEMKTSLSLKKIFTKRSNLSLSHQWERAFTDFQNLVPDGLIEGNANIRKNLIFTGVSNFQKISTVFSSFNILEQRSFLITASYTHHNFQYSPSSVKYPEYSISSFERFRDNSMLNVVASQQLYFHSIKSKIKFNLSWMERKSGMIVNGRLAEQRNKIGNLQVELNTGFDLPVNLNLSGRLNYSEFQWEKSNPTYNFQYSFYSKINWKVTKKMYMAGRWKMDLLAPKRAFNSIDYYMFFNFRKAFDIKLEIVNILNISTIDSRYVNEYSQTLSSFFLNKRFSLLTLEYNFK